MKQRCDSCSAAHSCAKVRDGLESSSTHTSVEALVAIASVTARRKVSRRPSSPTVSVSTPVGYRWVPSTAGRMRSGTPSMALHAAVYWLISSEFGSSVTTTPCAARSTVARPDALAALGKGAHSGKLVEHRSLMHIRFGR